MHGVVDKFLDSSGNTEFSNETSLLNRGYTGHEHFGVSLIYMNGLTYLQEKEMIIEVIG